MVCRQSIYGYCLLLNGSGVYRYVRLAVQNATHFNEEIRGAS